MAPCSAWHERGLEIGRSADWQQGGNDESRDLKLRKGCLRGPAPARVLTMAGVLTSGCFSAISPSGGGGGTQTQGTGTLTTASDRYEHSPENSYLLEGSRDESHKSGL